MASDVQHRGRLSVAFRRAYESAGLSQQALSELLGIDQSLISKYARGAVAPPLDFLEQVDVALARPRGHVLRLAGYVDDESTDAIAAIQHDPYITDGQRDALLLLYNLFRRQTADA